MLDMILLAKDAPSGSASDTTILPSFGASVLPAPPKLTVHMWRTEPFEDVHDMPSSVFVKMIQPVLSAHM